jgi:LMBR1 domain-containing protein 1
VIAALLRSPKLDEQQLDEDAEEAEEESLLASTGRQFDATWQDIASRPRGQDDAGRAGV